MRIHVPKTTAQEKGDLLEEAVRSIEDTILRSAPGFAEGTFKIHSKRIIQSAGVRHEVDLFVTAALPSGYEATFIFECKNWQAKVGKNEIIVFSEKVSAVGAQRGFFVARSFTKDARAQATKDQRIKLILASHVLPVVTIPFPQIVQTHIGKTSAHVQFCFVSPSKETLDTEPRLDEQILRVGAEVTLAREYINRWITNVRHEQVSKMPLSDTPDGDYTIEFYGQLRFAEGEAALDDEALQHIALQGTAEVTVLRAAVLSIFEIESRGRLLKVGIDHNGLEFRADIVELSI